MSDPRKKAWIRTRLTGDGTQLWCHATQAEIKRAIELHIPVHWLDDGTVTGDLTKELRFS